LQEYASNPDFINKITNTLISKFPYTELEWMVVFLYDL